MKFVTCAALLTVALAKKLTLRRNAAKAVSEVFAAQSCDHLQCPQGWRPKLNHHTLTGGKIADCCERTCELFTCTGIYRPNEDYWGNPGDSPQVCCDRMCGTDFECDVGYVLADATAAGVSQEECCKPKCALFECKSPWAPSPAKMEVVSSSAEDCCEPTCAQVNCSIPGWAVNASKAAQIGNSAEDCCTPLCGNSAQITCPSGSAVKPEDVNKTSDGSAEGCCQKQCKAHTCSEGWARDVSKDDVFADSDEACCVKTCKQFKCPVEDGWATDESLEKDIGDSVKQCCRPTCKQFTCNAKEGWLPGSNDAVAGQTSDKCCVKACSSYSCSANGLIQIPAAATTPGETAKACCESSKCEEVRKSMTPLGKEFCNEIKDADDCEKRFLKHTSESLTSIVLCSFDKTYNLCRYDTANAIKGGCSDV